MTNQPINRAERRKRETRQKLLMATASLLSQNDYANISVRAITDEADVGYGTFYLHFADKDDIVWEIIDGLIKQTDTAFKSNVASLPPYYQEFAFMQIIFEFFQNNQTQFLTVLGRNGSPTLAVRYRDAVAQLTMETMQRNEYQTIGMDIPIDFAANFVSGAILRLAVWWLESESNYSPRQMAEMSFKAIYQMEPPL